MLLHTESDTLIFGAQLAKVLPPRVVIFLNGSLGAGKTTLARGLIQGLGLIGKVKSPTYTLVEPYEVMNFTVFHFDLYRLQHSKELEEIGIQDYFSSPAICLIEWSEKGAPFLPEPDLIADLSYVGEMREIQLSANTALGQAILEKWESPHP